MTDHREPPLDDDGGQTSRVIGDLRRIASRRSVQRAGGWAAIVIFAGFRFAYSEIKHPSTPLRILALVWAVLTLVGLLALGVDAAKVARDWLWLRREDWRDWRR
jgi:hypothetical protein